MPKGITISELNPKYSSVQFTVKVIPPTYYFTSVQARRQYPNPLRFLDETWLLKGWGVVQMSSDNQWGLSMSHSGESLV